MSRLIPDWLAWRIVRWQYRKFPVVKVSPLMAQFIGGDVKFVDPISKQTYRSIAVRGDQVIAEKIS